MTKPRPIEICYLCGDKLGNGEPLSVDHVPARVIFPDTLRRERNFSKLTTLPTHQKCNGAYSTDEQYFVHSLGLLCNTTGTGKHVSEKIIDSTRKDRFVPLNVKIDREFYRHPVTRALYKSFDHDRINRVALKIVRGLWFERAGAHNILPWDWKTDFQLYDRNNPPPLELHLLLSQYPSWGEYQDVFMFKAFSSSMGVHAFALVFWQWLLVSVALHEAGCRCIKCGAAA